MARDCEVGGERKREREIEREKKGGREGERDGGREGEREGERERERERENIEKSRMSRIIGVDERGTCRNSQHHIPFPRARRTRSQKRRRPGPCAALRACKHRTGSLDWGRARSSCCAAGHRGRPCAGAPAEPQKRGVTRRLACQGSAACLSRPRERRKRETRCRRRLSAFSS